MTDEEMLALAAKAHGGVMNGLLNPGGRDALITGAA